MTISAGNRQVCPTKCKTSLAMIKRGGGPDHFTVTFQAIMGKLCRQMIWILNAAVIVLMTAETVSRQTAYLIVDMTADTLYCQMCPAYFKTGYLQMVEHGILPLILIMTGFTARRKTKFCMIRIMGRQIVRLVTSITIM